ncbi:MAG: hypothetical protein WCL57_03420 [Chloroflexota bacterium]|jgi:hypothetical protein|nr:hypothetical protein [Chloroflexota bacterium]
MSFDVPTITHELSAVFTKQQSSVLARVIHNAYTDLVKTSDFNELKEIIRELGQAQRELWEAQKDTKIEMGKLATEMQKLSQEMQKFSQGLTATRRDLAGLSQSFAYSFENEAYRMLPALLQEKYGIQITQRFLRRNVAGREVNFFAEATQNDEKVFIIGESKTRLSREDFEQLNDILDTVQDEYPQTRLLPLLVTHYAHPAMLAEAERRKVLVAQSFEW